MPLSTLSLHTGLPISAKRRANLGLPISIDEFGRGVLVGSLWLSCRVGVLRARMLKNLRRGRHNCGRIQQDLPNFVEDALLHLPLLANTGRDSSHGATNQSRQDSRYPVLPLDGILAKNNGTEKAWTREMDNGW